MHDSRIRSGPPVNAKLAPSGTAPSADQVRQGSTSPTVLAVPSGATRIAAGCEVARTAVEHLPALEHCRAIVLQEVYRLLPRTVNCGRCHRCALSRGLPQQGESPRLPLGRSRC